MAFPRRRSVAALAGFLVGAHGGTGVPAESLPIESKAYAVYNALLREWVDGDKRATVSVVRFTHLGSTDCLDDVERSVRWKSAVADLRRRNAATYTIEPRFDLPFRYELADTMEQVGGILPPPPGKDPGESLREGMARLDEMSKRHLTQVALSAPGISADGQLAIVYLSVSFAGAFHVLHKSGTKWIVRPDPKCRWISRHGPPSGEPVAAILGGSDHLWASIGYRLRARE